MRRAANTFLIVGLGCGALAACSSPATRAKAGPVAAPAAAVATTTAASSTTTSSTVPLLRRQLGFHRRLETPRPLRVLVVGDSVGITLARGLTTWARETGDAVVRDESRAWCSLGRYLPRNVFGPQNSVAGCDDWGTRWAQYVDSFDPDVVFVMYTVWEVMPRLLPGASDFAVPGDAALDAWQLSEYQAAADVLSARGARVVFFSIACENNTTIERGEPFWFVNRGTLPLLAQSRPAVRLIDLDRLLCGGGRMRNDLGGVADIRPDHAHFSDAGALAVARWLMPIVQGRTRPPPYALS